MATSCQPQIPSRRPRALRDPPRPSSSPAPPIQSQVANRDHLRGCSTAQTATHRRRREPKRARTALSGRTPPALSSSGSGGARDWADIGGDGPTGLIAERVLANDLADYVRFRAVCRSWRRCSPDPRAAGLQFGRFLPRRWIMLDKAHAASRRHRFLNVCTGECIRTDLPELAEHTLLALTPEGLLLLFHEPTLVVRLLNPLTRRLTDLPPVTALLTPEQRRRPWRSGFPVGDALWAYGVGLADASTVAVCFGCPNVLAVARPGDEHWALVDGDDRYIDSALSFAGRFYCAIGSSVMVLDTDQQPPRLRRLVDTERSMSFLFCPLYGSLHLVDNAGELMLVYRVLDTDAQGVETRKYAVFRVDLDAGALVPVKDLRGRAVFMSLGRTISVSPGAFSSVTADTLYLGFDCDEKTMMNRIDGYNVADGSSEPSHHDEWLEMEAQVQPWSVVDCLSYCIQGNGDHLA